jgi:hypothetical protein
MRAGGLTASDNETNTIVIENEALRRGFTLIPNYVLRNPNLSFGARLTYTLLLSYAWQEGSCFPGQVRLAEHLHSDPRSVRRYLAELKGQGLIAVRRRGLGRTNVYVLTDTTSYSEADRTLTSTPERTLVSAQDRTDTSTEEDPVDKDAEGQKPSTVNRLANKEINADARAGFARVSELLTRRAQPVGDAILDRKQEVKPLAEAAARRLRAPKSLGMFYKVLLQLYPEHCYLFEEAVKEAAAERKVKVSRSALFAHIVRRLAREHGVQLRLGKSQLSESTST